MRTFISAPSRDLTIKVAPSTLSMVPRMRTGGACCAHATDPSIDMTVSDAAIRRDLDQEMFGMVLSFRAFPGKTANPANSRLFRAATHGHIGGVRPSRQTLTRLVSNVPSGSFFMKAITLAPALRSDLSAGT